MPDSSLSPHPSPDILVKFLALPGEGHPLPLVIYRDALPADRRDLAGEIEKLYHDHSWQGAWRWSLYDFHHRHSNAHEVLAVFSGHASIQFGGEGGPVFDVRIGDVILIPAGLLHRKTQSSEDFQVVGAYPAGQLPDTLREGEPVKNPVREVPLPVSDPIYGASGPLMRLWK